MIHQGELGVAPRQDMLHGVLHFHTSHNGNETDVLPQEKCRRPLQSPPPIRYTHCALRGLASVWPSANRSRADWDGSRAQGLLPTRPPPGVC
jgi:hypothetical protein